MNYSQMLNFLPNFNCPNVDQTQITGMNTHNDDIGQRNHYQGISKPDYQTGNQQNQPHRIQHQVHRQQIHRQFKIEPNEKTHPKQTRNRTKFTDDQIEKLEGN